MSKRVLIIGTVWPEPKSSAAGTRMLQLINALLYDGYRIHFVSAAAKTENTYDLSSLGIDTTSIKLNNSGFDEFIVRLNPDIVIYDRFMTEEQYGWRVAEHCPDAVRILDTEDLHFLRKAREEALNQELNSEKSNLINEVTKREVASIYRCDLSLIISEFEMNLLTDQFNIPNELLLYLPFKVSTDDLNKEKLPAFEERFHCNMIGNFLHKPNKDAIRFLKNEIWPIIRKHLPETEVHIYGAYATSSDLLLNDPTNGFMVKGYATEVDQVMQSARVCLVPLRFGAGLKGKMFDAMRNGTPCVTSSIGAEGIFDGLELNGFIADQPNDFADKVIQLYTDEILWNEKSERGFELLKARFDSTTFQSIFKQSLDNLMNSYKQRREANFIGQMLFHHSLQSTKFMSKWIEEKQKKTT